MQKSKAIGTISRAIETNQALMKNSIKEGNFETASFEARRNELIILKSFLELVTNQEFAEIAGRKPQPTKPPNSLFF